ncbi:shikimate kinase [Rosistilla oblonga]|uniref:shikimate kinase n=1 Tax=Rosistilla oblonga TaxID=2527990 RepID=UPI003A97B892
MLNSKHLYLIGYRGSGKSSVARLLAAKIGCTWIDSDDEIERRAGVSIAEIFAAHGEPGFRDRETAAIEALSKTSPQVIALGGGAILRPENRDMIAQTGQAIWLDARPEVLVGRIEADASSASRRPSLTEHPMLQEVRQLMAAREPLYREVGNLRIDVSDQTPDQIVDQITKFLSDQADSLLE